jgi:hypothetical protein
VHTDTAVRLEEFREAIKTEFGSHLEHATPANVREFLDRIQQNHHQESFAGRVELNEPATDFEEILKDFFARVLYYPQDEALILLWTMAFDLSFSALELQLADKLDTLFKDGDN